MMMKSLSIPKGAHSGMDSCITRTRRLDATTMDSSILMMWPHHLLLTVSMVGDALFGTPKRCTDCAEWCVKGIVGRGVLLDWPRWLKETGQEPLSPAASHGKPTETVFTLFDKYLRVFTAISADDLQAIAKHQNLSFRPGDILIVRTGFDRWLKDSSKPERDKVFSTLSFSGVEAGEDTERWLWNTGFSAVAGDSVSWERKFISCPAFHLS